MPRVDRKVQDSQIIKSASDGLLQLKGLSAKKKDYVLVADHEVTAQGTKVIVLRRAERPFRDPKGAFRDRVQLANQTVKDFLEKSLKATTVPEKQKGSIENLLKNIGANRDGSTKMKVMAQHLQYVTPAPVVQKHRVTGSAPYYTEKPYIEGLAKGLKNTARAYDSGSFKSGAQMAEELKENLKDCDLKFGKCGQSHPAYSTIRKYAEKLADPHIDVERATQLASYLATIIRDIEEALAKNIDKPLASEDPHDDDSADIPDPLNQRRNDRSERHDANSSHIEEFVIDRRSDQESGKIPHRRHRPEDTARQNGPMNQSFDSCKENSEQDAMEESGHADDAESASEDSQLEHKPKPKAKQANNPAQQMQRNQIPAPQSQTPPQQSQNPVQQQHSAPSQGTSQNVANRRALYKDSAQNRVQDPRRKLADLLKEGQNKNPKIESASSSEVKDGKANSSAEQSASDSVFSS